MCTIVIPCHDMPALGVKAVPGVREKTRRQILVPPLSSTVIHVFNSQLIVENFDDEGFCKRRIKKTFGCWWLTQFCRKFQMCHTSCVSPPNIYRRNFKGGKNISYYTCDNNIDPQWFIESLTHCNDTLQIKLHVGLFDCMMSISGWNHPIVGGKKLKRKKMWCEIIWTRSCSGFVPVITKAFLRYFTLETSKQYHEIDM